MVIERILSVLFPKREDEVDKVLDELLKDAKVELLECEEACIDIDGVQVG